MTVPATNNRVSYSGNGSTTAFAFAYPFRATSDLVVTVRTTSTGAESLQTEGTHYTVTGTPTSDAGGFASGTVTFVTAPASGTQVHIDREPARTQTTDYIAGDGIPPSSIEGSLDRLTLLVQDLESRLARTLMQPRTAANRSLALPEPTSATVNQVLGVNAAGTAYSLRSVTGVNQIATVLDFGAVGGGTINDSAAFSAANTAGKLTIIPKIAGGYELTSPITTTAAAWLIDPTLTWSDATDDGQLDLRRGFWTSSNPDGANIWRFADRVFVGEAASKWAGNSSVSPDAGTSWFSQDADGPSYLGVNAVLLSISRESNVDGRYAIVGASKVSALTPAGGIGVAGAIINSKAGGSGWALYSDVQHENTGWSSGLEVAAKNASGVDLTATPYTDNNGVYGVWLAGGGDNSYGPAATNPSNAAMVVLKNATTWNSGVVFKDDGLTGTDGTSGSTGTGIAIAMARRHAIRWYEPTNLSTGAQIVSSVTAAANKVGITLADGQVQFIAPNDAVMGAVIASGTVANYVGLTGVATGSAASVSALGSDSNIDLAITPKGTGNLKFGTHTASGDAAVSGYITIKDAGGTTRKLAVIT